MLETTFRGSVEDRPVEAPTLCLGDREPKPLRSRCLQRRHYLESANLHGLPRFPGRRFCRRVLMDVSGYEPNDAANQNEQPADSTRYVARDDEHNRPDQLTRMLRPYDRHYSDDQRE